MNKKLISDSAVGIACCGIYYALKHFNHFIYRAERYIKGYQLEKKEFPFSNLTIYLKIQYENQCYSIQVAPVSPNNEFAVISGNSYSVIKVVGKRNLSFHIAWNGDNYFIEMEKKFNIFCLTINQSATLTLTKVDDDGLDSSFLEFPTNVDVQSDEPNLVLETCLKELNYILIGYNRPGHFFVTHLHSQLDKLFNILRNPLLPSMQFQKFLDDAGHVLPTGLIDTLRQLIGQYTLNFSSFFSRFPSTKIEQVIENYLDGLEKESHREDMREILRPMMEMARMFSDGIRGNVKCVVEKLLLDYLKVEIKFQEEETISNCKMTSQPLEISDMISHNNLPDKNKLILILLEFLEKFLPGIISDLRSTIQQLLSHLSGNSYSNIIPKLREVLITGQIPSYEVRKNEMEAIFLNSINGYSNVVQTARLENLICSNSEVFDIISDFFYHKKIEVRKCAMEVYVRRAYMIYEICSFEQCRLANGQLCVLFKFALPTNTSRKDTTGQEIKRSNSYVALIHKKASIPRKSLQICRTSNSLDKEEMSSDGDLPNGEDYCQGCLDRQRSNDNDTDSAISVGAYSLSELSATVSEQVDNDCVNDHQGGRPRYSPSTHSLDRCLPVCNQSSAKDTTWPILSNGSLNNTCIPYRHSRHVSMFTNNNLVMPNHDFSDNCDLGSMIIFETLEEIENNLSSIQDVLLLRNSSMDYIDYDSTAFDRDSSPSYKITLKFFLRDPQLMIKYDEEVSSTLLDFCDKNSSFFVDICAVRVTFLLQATDKTIRYFTFRKRRSFEEDIKLRNIDPILSFQLEINRLRNYQLERLPVPNRMMYVYMGRCKEINSHVTAEYRMFTRCIIHHKDFNSSTSNVEYMAKEAERNLTEAMDAFDMACVDERAKLTKSNHIFFYFHSILCIDKIEELEDVVRAIIFKHGSRLWSLRITQAELKMSVKLNNSCPIPVRLWVHNEGGNSLEICIYREELQLKTDKCKVLISWSTTREGRYHGVPVDCFYSI